MHMYIQICTYLHQNDNLSKIREHVIKVGTCFDKINWTKLNVIYPIKQCTYVPIG